MWKVGDFRHMDRDGIGFMKALGIWDEYGKDGWGFDREKVKHGMFKKVCCEFMNGTRRVHFGGAGAGC